MYSSLSLSCHLLFPHTLVSSPPKWPWESFWPLGGAPLLGHMLTQWDTCTHPVVAALQRARHIDFFSSSFPLHTPIIFLRSTSRLWHIHMLTYTVEMYMNPHHFALTYVKLLVCNNVWTQKSTPQLWLCSHSSKNTMYSISKNMFLADC